MENFHPSCEWLQTNRFGSYAMGCVDRIPRRKYHSLLCLREPGVGEPLNTLVDVGEYIEVNGSLYMLHSMDFGGKIEPKGFMHLRSFSCEPYPKWTYDVGGMKIERLVSMDSERDVVTIFYKISSVLRPVKIRLRPLVVCRPMHHLAQANPFLNGGVTQEAGATVFRFYDSLPSLRMRVAGVNAQYFRRGEWVNGVHYNSEEDRGYPAYEDIFAPGEFEFIVKGDASFSFELGAEKLDEMLPRMPKEAPFPTLINKLEAAGEQFQITTKSDFHSMIAGYPWFGHWGRDTFLSIPGLCFNSGRPRDIKTAIEILRSYGNLIVEGLTRSGIVCAFPEKGLIMTGIDTPLLYIRAVQALKECAPSAGHSEFMPVVCRILNAMKNGADRRIQITQDCGLFVQHGPWAVTWMDVLLDGQPVTPRTGFAVDINALFLNAVHFALDWADVYDKSFAKEWSPLLEKAQDAFLTRFWSEKYGFLADCHSGENPDFSLRPNQLWAIALPNSPISREQGKRILEAVRRDLLTPVGLRTLSPHDPKYKGRYHGGQRERDLAYHQGTVWPWLIGIYADAVYKVYGARQMKEEMGQIVAKLEQHLDKEGCLGQISEVFDGDSPHQPGGTPAQAWSVAELLRVVRRMEL